MKLPFFTFVEFVLFLQLLRGFDLRWGSFSGDVEEVYVCLDESLLEKFDRLSLSCDFFLKFEVVLLFLEVIATAIHELLISLESIGCGLLAILIKDLGFCFNYEFVFLLLLSLLLHLSHLGMGVINGSQFHLNLNFLL